MKPSSNSVLKFFLLVVVLPQKLSVRMKGNTSFCSCTLQWERRERLENFIVARLFPKIFYLSFYQKRKDLKILIEIFLGKLFFFLSWENFWFCVKVYVSTNIWFCENHFEGIFLFLVEIMMKTILANSQSGCVSSTALTCRWISRHYLSFSWRRLRSFIYKTQKCLFSFTYICCVCFFSGSLCRYTCIFCLHLALT